MFVCWFSAIYSALFTFHSDLKSQPWLFRFTFINTNRKQKNKKKRHLHFISGHTYESNPVWNGVGFQIHVIWLPLLLWPYNLNIREKKYFFLHLHRILNEIKWQKIKFLMCSRMTTNVYCICMSNHVKLTK